MYILRYLWIFVGKVPGVMGWKKFYPLLLGKYLWEKNHTVLNETASSPGITGKQTFLLQQCGTTLQPMLTFARHYLLKCKMSGKNTFF
jgi:hypothetical protein